VGLLGILKAGGAYVPLDPGHPPERLRYLLLDSNPAVVLTQKRLVGNLPSTRAVLLTIDGDWERNEAQPREAITSPPQHLSSRNLAYVRYTSGSTGNPKGVMVEHAAVTHFLTSMQREPGLTPSDCLLAVTTLSFDMAVLEIYLPLITGARLVIANREAALDPHQLIALLEQHRVTVLQATPATWQLLLSARWQGIPGLKALCGGEALTPILAQKLLERVGCLWNLYGPTETTVYSSGRQIEHANMTRPFETIGRPVAHARMWVLDNEHRPESVGVNGEIYIGGAGLARGYLNHPDLTAERFLPALSEPGTRMYRPGDRALITHGGEIEYLGRTDTQLKIRGHRIEPGEIEAVLLQHPAVAQASVITRESRPGDMILVAYLVSATDVDRPGVEELRAVLERRLPQYMRPAALVWLDALPVTLNGKLDIEALKALAAPALDTSSTAKYEAPRTALEQTLADLYAELLGLDRVGIHDSFRELGGHSVLIMKLVGAIHEQLKIRIGVQTVSESPSIAALATALMNAQLVAAQAPAAQAHFEEGLV
jgi:amino acid adenylation domain-containing protein